MSVVCPKPDCVSICCEAKKDAEINIVDAFADINPAYCLIINAPQVSRYRGRCFIEG